MRLPQLLKRKPKPAPEETIQKEWEHLLAAEEQITASYKQARNYFIFTSCRLILIDVQGHFRKHYKVSSIPYRQIVYFTIESTKPRATSATLTLWIASQPEGLHYALSSKVNIYEIQANLAKATAEAK